MHFSSGSLLGYFPSKVSFSDNGSRLGFVGGIEESSVEVLVCQMAAWACRMEGPKLIVVCCCFLQLHYSGELLPEAFLAATYFSCGGSRMGFILSHERNLVEVVV